MAEDYRKLIQAMKATDTQATPRNFDLPQPNRIGFDYREVRQLINKTYDIFSNVNYDDSLSLQQAMNALLEMWTVVLKENTEFKEMILAFLEQFDTQLYETVSDILTKWNEDGTLDQIIIDDVFTELKNLIEDLQSLQVNGVYSTLEDLQTAKPNGVGICVVTSENKWYYWDVEAKQWKTGGSWLVPYLTKRSVYRRATTWYTDEFTDIFDVTAYTTIGYYNYSTGALINNTSYRSYTFPVVPGDRIRIYDTRNNESRHGTWWNASGTFQGGSSNRSFLAPSSATELRVGLRIDESDFVIITKNELPVWNDPDLLNKSTNLTELNATLPTFYQGVTAIINEPFLTKINNVWSKNAELAGSTFSLTTNQHRYSINYDDVTINTSLLGQTNAHTWTYFDPDTSTFYLGEFTNAQAEIETLNNAIFTGVIFTGSRARYNQSTNVFPVNIDGYLVGGKNENNQVQRGQVSSFNKSTAKLTIDYVSRKIYLPTGAYYIADYFGDWEWWSKTSGSELITDSSSLLLTIPDSTNTFYLFLKRKQDTVNMLDYSEGYEDNGYYSASTGTFVTNASYRSYEITGVKEGQNLVMSGTKDGGGRHVTFWNGATFVSGVSGDSSLSITIPAGVTSLKYGLRNDEVQTVLIGEATYPTLLMKNSQQYKLERNDDEYYLGMVTMNSQNDNINFPITRIKSTNVTPPDDDDIKYYSIVGDSISTFKDYIPVGTGHYPTASVPTVDLTWWWKLASRFDGRMELLVNNSRSGSQVTDTGESTGEHSAQYRCEYLDKDGQEPNIILFYMGSNDFNRNIVLGDYDPTSQDVPTSVTEFKSAYYNVLSKMNKKYPEAKIICFTLHFNGYGGFPRVRDDGVTMFEFNQAIKDVAKVFNCEIVDLEQIGFTENNILINTEEGLHPTAIGMDTIYRKAYSVVRNLFD